MNELDGKYISEMIHDVISTPSADSDMKRENANVDADSTMGSMLKIGSEVCKMYALENIFSDYRKYHEEGLIHIHDLDFSALTINCLYIPLSKVLKGFSTGHGSVRRPKDIRTAAALTCIAIQSSQNDFFGGQGIAAFDYSLAPYVGVTFAKNFITYLRVMRSFGNQYSYGDEQLKKVILDPAIEYCFTDGNHLLSEEGYAFLKHQFSELICHYMHGDPASALVLTSELTTKRLDEALNFAMEETIRHTEQAMEGLVHNLCTMNSRAGAQVPFSSVNFGTDTSKEGRLVSLSLLKAIECGMGGGETAIFPIAIMKMKKGITDEGSPNHDIFKRAVEVSAKRLYPNFINLDASFNAKYYDPNNPDTEAASMGCLRGDTKILVTDRQYRKVHTPTIKEFIEYKNARSCRVWDTIEGDWVGITNLICNENVSSWVRIETTNSNVIIATEDHYFPVHRDGIYVRTRATHLQIGDQLALSTKGSIDEPVIYTTIASVGPYDIEENSYCLSTETDRFDANGICVHNCRTRVIGNVYDNTKEVTSGRGNLFVTTINLPYVALKALEITKDEGSLLGNFYEQLMATIDLCISLSNDRYEVIAHRKAHNYPFMAGQGLYLGSDELDYDSEIESMLRNGTRTIGFIGLAEALVALTGSHHGASDQSAELGLNIVKYMHDYISRLAEETNINYSLMASPAEGCTGRLAKLTRERFGTIPGVTDKDYLTNSFHVPPKYEISAYDKVAIEAPYHALCPAGSISYIEIDSDATKNLEGFSDLVNFMANSNMGYFSINHPVDRDPVCGYIGHIPHDGVCPRCGRRDGEGVRADVLLKVQTRKTADARYALSASMFEEE